MLRLHFETNLNTLSEPLSGCSFMVFKRTMMITVGGMTDHLRIFYQNKKKVYFNNMLIYGTYIQIRPLLHSKCGKCIWGFKKFLNSSSPAERNFRTPPHSAFNDCRNILSPWIVHSLVTITDDVNINDTDNDDGTMMFIQLITFCQLSRESLRECRYKFISFVFRIAKNLRLQTPKSKKFADQFLCWHEIKNNGTRFYMWKLYI